MYNYVIVLLFSNVNRRVLIFFKLFFLVQNTVEQERDHVDGIEDGSGIGLDHKVVDGPAELYEGEHELQASRRGLFV